MSCRVSGCGVWGFGLGTIRRCGTWVCVGVRGGGVEGSYGYEGLETRNRCQI